MKPSEIEAELKLIDEPNSEWYRRYPRGRAPGEDSRIRERLRNQLSLWARRKNLPRCLVCGLPGVSFFVEGKWTPHPGSGEEVLFSCVAICSDGFAMRFFDPDGVELTLTETERKHCRSLVDAAKNL